VLLADEPVSMLDVSVKVEILRVLNECRESMGLALLYVTHDIASARWCADTISVMYAGQIVESGPSDEVTQRAKHPYTQLLIRSTPDPAAGHTDGASHGDSRSVERAGPDREGCRFRSNCPSAMARCATAEPPVVQFSEDQWVRCWLYDSGPPAATATLSSDGDHRA
jgi:peptide/nickel transport system ATP-binding protein